MDILEEIHKDVIQLMTFDEARHSSTIFSKEDSFCDFLFPSFDKQPLPIGLPLKKRIYTANSLF